MYLPLNSANPQLSIQTHLNPFDHYSDSRKHGYQGGSRNVRLGRVTPSGGGAIAKSEDGIRCAIAGKESLRIVRISENLQVQNPDHKSAVGPGGHRIDASRNFWDGSGLKIDSASTDVAWGHGLFNNKILTSARNGELILWDLNKSGVTKYERRTKDHIRSINKMSVSQVVHHYCITGSADGDLRVWDLRDLTKSIMRVHHPTSVRSVVFSPSYWQPLQAVAGLDNGSIYRWDLKMGQRGLLDKLPVAHTASVTSLDWCCAGGVNPQSSGAMGVAVQNENIGLGWLVSGGLDRCVKVWDLTAPGTGSHIPHRPTYTLHPSFAIRRVAWRPGYQCEIALVSSTEFATGPSDSSQASPGSNPSGLLTRAGSSSGLDSVFRGPSGLESIYAVKDKLNVPTVLEPKSLTLASGVGDSVEIWDVRRGWIAKWSVAGSAVEGGISDIAFGDSHAIWAQHASGSFSQIDLRDATKPLDAIPRVAATWEVTGSIAFVTEKKNHWEIPYDDLQPDAQRYGSELRKTSKALGDPPARITTQSMATYVHDSSTPDLETFMHLAKAYVFEGRDRTDICAYNSAIAFSAGHESAAQFWLLLGATLARYLPSFPPSPPRSPRPKPKSATIPSNLQNSPRASSIYSFPASFSQKTAEPSSFGYKISPGRRSVSNGDVSKMAVHNASSSTTRRLTPTSSSSPSPRHFPVSLPPPTPRMSTLFSRRDSVDSNASSQASIYRRASINSGDRSVSSLRHVGEGVLDSSSSSSGSDGGEEGSETAGAKSSDPEISLRPLDSPLSTALRMMPAPSPLSRVAGRHVWTEDELDGEGNDDDASSPSPQSTDTDSNGSSPPRRTRRPSMTSRRGTGRIKSRSRSSTVASLPAPPQPLIHRGSRSSIRTVTVGETSFNGQGGNGFQQESSSPYQRSPYQRSHAGLAGHGRQRSQAISELMLNGAKSAPVVDQDERNDSPDDNRLSERRIEAIMTEEVRIKETTLCALQEGLEVFAEEGDVQMCAMLALVAAEELRVSRLRATRFLDSYIELLTRLRLHTCTAYLRKYCQKEEIRNITLLETTIYTSCGKCRKPLLLPAGICNNPPELNRGGFSYCLACSRSCVMCSICHLPVRTLLFQCAVCNHGGHQSCYREYYMRQPMVDLPSSFLPQLIDVNEDDSSSSSTISSQSTPVDPSITESPLQQSHISTKLAGHLCAAGCGHFCWAANRDSEE
ncbi:hypothetical protein BYT27DRAFT_7158298 [Phlegmacium glaucopus]|nr:hypothetical protein BYT27DRAFT_7158298 [Phlegmacium glaucopus]